ncbi:MAG: hypothetical protein U0271_06820 [Polyangiaceae bacterium]
MKVLVDAQGWELVADSDDESALFSTAETIPAPPPSEKTPPMGSSGFFSRPVGQDLDPSLHEQSGTIVMLPPPSKVPEFGEQQPLTVWQDGDRESVA